ncbi:hypothetical protein PCE1_004243 [Barthelona sp. PCE]
MLNQEQFKLIFKVLMTEEQKDLWNMFSEVFSVMEFVEKEILVTHQKFIKPLSFANLEHSRIIEILKYEGIDKKKIWRLMSLYHNPLNSILNEEKEDLFKECVGYITETNLDDLGDEGALLCEYVSKLEPEKRINLFEKFHKFGTIYLKYFEQVPEDQKALYVYSDCHVDHVDNVKSSINDVSNEKKKKIDYIALNTSALAFDENWKKNIEKVNHFGCITISYTIFFCLTFLSILGYFALLFDYEVYRSDEFLNSGYCKAFFIISIVLSAAMPFLLEIFKDKRKIYVIAITIVFLAIFIANYNFFDKMMLHSACLILCFVVSIFSRKVSFLIFWFQFCLFGMLTDWTKYLNAIQGYIIVSYIGFYVAKAIDLFLESINFIGIAAMCYLFDEFDIKKISGKSLILIFTCSIGITTIFLSSFLNRKYQENPNRSPNDNNTNRSPNDNNTNCSPNVLVQFKLDDNYCVTDYQNHYRIYREDGHKHFFNWIEYKICSDDTSSVFRKVKKIMVTKRKIWQYPFLNILGPWSWPFKKNDSENTLTGSGEVRYSSYRNFVNKKPKRKGFFNQERDSVQNYDIYGINALQRQLAYEEYCEAYIIVHYAAKDSSDIKSRFKDQLEHITEFDIVKFTENKYFFSNKKRVVPLTVKFVAIDDPTPNSGVNHDNTTSNNDASPQIEEPNLIQPLLNDQETQL